MCPKCLINQLVGVLQLYMEDETRLYRPARVRRAINLIVEAKAMSHSHDDMISLEEAEEASRT